MTVKRFTITQDFEEHHRQIRDNGKIIMGCFLEPQAEPIVKLLNELHEENQYLKSLKWNQDCIKEISISIQQKQLLEKENEQLKTTIQQLRTDNTKQKKKLNTTMKENEHIKTTIKDMINTERTEIGKMTLRQLWRQIQ